MLALLFDFSVYKLDRSASMKSGKHFPNYKFLRGLDRARRASLSLSLSLLFPFHPPSARTIHSLPPWIAAIPSVRLDLSDFAPGVEKNVRGSGCARSIPSFSLARLSLSPFLSLQPPSISFLFTLGSRSSTEKQRIKEYLCVCIYIYMYII